MSEGWQPRIPTTRWWERSFIVHVIQRWTVDLVVDAYRFIRRHTPRRSI